MRSSVTVNMDDGIPSSSSDSEMTSKRKKKFHATFKIQMKIHCLSLKTYDGALFKNGKKTCLCTEPIKVNAELFIGKNFSPET